MRRGRDTSRFCAAAMGMLAAVLLACPREKPVDEAKTKLRTPVAECIVRKGEVRAHPPNEWVWNAVDVGARFAAGDWVRTSTRSEAVLSYLSGSTLVVQPSSIVILRDAVFEKGRSVYANYLLVQKGAVRGKIEPGPRSEEIVVETSEGEHVRLSKVGQMDAMAYRLSARPDGAIEVAVTEGRGRLVAEDGRNVVLARGQAHDLRGGTFVGAIVALPEAPGLLSPPDGATVTLRPEESFEVAWSPVQGVTTYRVEVALDQAFDQVVDAAVTADASWRVVPAGSGTFHWRVASRTADDRDGEFGLHRRAEVEVSAREETGDLLLSPVDGAVITSADRWPLVAFSWRPVAVGTVYRLTVAKDDALAETVLVETTTEEQLSVRSLAPGSYAWGVFLVTDGGVRPGFTSPRRLRLERALGIKTPDRITFE